MTRVTLLLKTNEGGLWVVPQLRELRERGAEVTAMIPTGDGRLRRALDAEGIPVQDSPFTFTFTPRPELVRGLLRLRRAIAATQPDVVFYHLYASALAARFATMGTGVRRVHMVAGPLYLENPTIRRLERRLMRLDDRLIAGSRFTAAAYADLGLPARRLVTIPYGVDTARFCPGVRSDRGAIGLDPGAFVVIMIAYVYAPKPEVFNGAGIKGHAVLLQAWTRFTHAHPGARLVLVGSGFDGAGERYRKRLMERYDVATDPSIRWIDQVDDVRPFYRCADLSVSPSLSENHGAALEAGAMGVPSIVSDAGALPEAVTDHSGWVVPAGDAPALTGALNEAFQQSRTGELSSRGAAARSHVREQFEQRACSALVAETILEVAPGRGPNVAAFTEQRIWRENGELVGRKSLGFVSAIARTAPVSLNAREGAPEPGGTPLAPGANLRLLTAAGTDSRGMKFWAGFGLLWKIFTATRRADVVYADQPGLVGGLGLLMGRLNRKPLVVNVVGDSAESVHPCVIPGLKGRLAHLVLPRLQRWACAHAAVVNYVTSRTLQERYPARRANRRFAVSTAIPLGPARPRPFPDGRISVVTVASLEQPYKGVAELIDAVSRCRRTGLDISLTVVGDGRLRPELETQVPTGLGGHITFAGHLYGPDLYNELGRHDVFVLASWTEGLPRALVEAMLDGMPAVATSVGGVVELLEQSRQTPPRDPHALAAAIASLGCDEQAWLATIEHNRRIGGRVGTQPGHTVNDVAEAVIALGRRG